MKLTGFMSGDPVMVNISKVRAMTKMEGNGCVLIFEGGDKLSVKEDMDQVWEMVKQFLIEM